MSMDSKILVVSDCKGFGTSFKINLVPISSAIHCEAPCVIPFFNIQGHFPVTSGYLVQQRTPSRVHFMVHFARSTDYLKKSLTLGRIPGTSHLFFLLMYTLENSQSHGRLPWLLQKYCDKFTSTMNGFSLGACDKTFFVVEPPFWSMCMWLDTSISDNSLLAISHIS